MTNLTFKVAVKIITKQRVLLLFIGFFLPFVNSQTVFGQQWIWAINGSGGQYDVADKDIAVANDGTQFITGYFTNTITLGAFTLINPDDYYSDMYLARIDSSGGVIWAKAINLGSTYNDALGICLDGLNSIFVTGAYNGKVLVSKFDASGLLIWNSNIVEKNFYGYGKDIAIDQFENIFIAGVENGSSILAKLNADGKFQWSAKIQGCNSNGCWGNDLAVDRLGNW
jgi:hypothetical protein